METRTIKAKTPKLELSVRFLPSTLNPDERTVEMVFTTSDPAKMRRWKGWEIEEFNEILSMDKAHLNLNRMNRGAPLLNNHSRWDLNDQIGVVEKAWTEGDELRGLVRFSKRADVEPIFQDVKDGIIRNGSIGYRVTKYKDETKEGDAVKTLRAIDWEPFEMSLVPVGADMRSQVRTRAENNEEFEVEIETKNERILGMDKPNAAENKDLNLAEADEIRKLEREKNAKIIRACKRAKLSELFAEGLVASGKSLETCLEEIQEKWAENDAKKTITPARDLKIEMGEQNEVDTRREGAAEAILHRHFPGEHKLTERAHKFQGRTAVELCRQILELNGIRAESMNRDEVVKRAFMSTSDFPNILENVASKRLQKGFESVPQIFKQFSVETTLKDFKPSSVVALGEAPELELLGESAEIKMGTMGDSKEQIKLATFAKGMAVTRQTVINDDLGAFGKAASAFGRAGANLENEVGFGDAFLDNPTMGDNVVLFHATHRNLATASLLDETNLGKMKALMRKQKDDKNKAINLVPKFLICGPDQEVAALKLLAPVSGNAGFNVFANQFTLLISSQITDNSSYLVADPGMIEGLQHAYLEGAQGIQIETKDHPSTLGIVIRAYLDFAAKAINWRAFIKNAGV